MGDGAGGLVIILMKKLSLKTRLLNELTSLYWTDVTSISEFKSHENRSQTNYENDNKRDVDNKSSNIGEM